MVVAIIGSRSLKMDISNIIPKNITRLISGGAKGIDQCAERYTDENNIPKLIFKPEYLKYGLKAPLIRYKLIIDCADFIVIIWDRKSKNIRYAIEYAQKISKKFDFHLFHGNLPIGHKL